MCLIALCACALGGCERDPFTTEFKPLEARLPLRISLDPTSMSRQEGFVGMPAEKPLRVVVRHQRTGRPVADIPLLFEIQRGNGEMLTDTSLSTITDEKGRAGVRFLLGTAPFENGIVTNEIKVYILLNETEPVLFTLVGRLPRIERAGPVTAAESLDSLFPGGEISGPQGSALPLLATIKVSDSQNGDLLQGVGLFPQVLDKNGNPLPMLNEVGEFFPLDCSSDAAGEGRFAFVIHPSAAPGEYRLRVRAAGFWTPDNKLLAMEARLVIHALSKEPPRVLSGNGQIGIPGKPLSNPLAMEVVADKVRVSSMSGDGIEVVQGKVVEVIERNPDGSARVVAAAPNESKRIALRVTLGDAIGARLMTVEGHPTLTWAAGTPDDRLVRRAYQRDADGYIVRDASGYPVVKTAGPSFEFIGYDAPDPFLHGALAYPPEPQFTPDPADEFFFEARAPDLGPTIPGRLKELDAAGELLPRERSLSPVDTEIPLLRRERVEGRYFFYRSDAVVLSSATAGSDTPPPGSLVRLATGQWVVQGGRGASPMPVLPVPTAHGIRVDEPGTRIVRHPAKRLR